MLFALTQFDWMVIIFLLVIGPAVGNYACSVIYRLPLGRTPFERHPYCGSCDADLKPIDLFPIFSWLSTAGRCRYCRAKIPGIYTVVEIACAVAFITYYLFYTLSDFFLIACFYATFVIILAAIQWRQKWIAATIYSYAFLSAVLFVSMFDGTIFGWVKSSFITLVFSLLVLRFHTWIFKREFRPFDAPWVWWLTLMAVWLPPTAFDWQITALSIPIAILLIFRFLCNTAGPYALFPVAAFAMCLPLIYF